LADCITFFKTHADAGAVGVRMLDDKGKFLKESKRGLPSPSASFYKLFGLTAIFPGSKKIANITRVIYRKMKTIPLMFYPALL
jgi:hypothetical protein